MGGVCQDLEFVQGQSRDVPDRELVLNITTLLLWIREFDLMQTGIVF